MRSLRKSHAITVILGLARSARLTADSDLVDDRTSGKKFISLVMVVGEAGLREIRDVVVIAMERDHAEQPIRDHRRFEIDDVGDFGEDISLGHRHIGDQEFPAGTNETMLRAQACGPCPIPKRVEKKIRGTGVENSAGR